MAAYPAAILLAFFSAVVIILIIPPLFWHIKHGNFGAASVIGWIIVVNSMSFMNAIIWPNDDFQSHSFGGAGLCDIQVKIQVASQVAFPAAFACILRALARVMDTKRPMLSRSEKQRKWDLVIDLLWCFGFPGLQMLFHYIVQPVRYFIFGICGCDAAVSPTWATIWLIHIPPVIWTLLCAVYSVIILVRLYRHRKSIRSILDHNDTNKSRFVRLFLLCILWIFANVPIQFYAFSLAFHLPRETFNWSDIHDPDQWNHIIMVPSNGIILYDRYIWLSAGAAMFIFFGFGTEAVAMYKSILDKSGLGHIVMPVRAHVVTWSQAMKHSSSTGSTTSKARLWDRNIMGKEDCGTTIDSCSDDIELGTKHVSSY